VSADEFHYNTCTDSNGNFTIESMPYGSYAVVSGNAYNWCLDQNSPYIKEYYDGVRTTDQATLVEISEAQDTVTGINLNLDQGGVVSGTVRAQEGGMPLENVHVVASSYDEPGLYWLDGYTDANGDYTITGLGTDVYRIRVDDPNFIPEGYAGQYYDHVQRYDLATPLPVAEGSVLTNIDFDLPPGGMIRGRVLDSQSGLPIPNLNIEARSRDYGAGGCTDEQGYYQLGGLIFSDYEVLVGGDYNWCLNQPGEYGQEFYQDTASEFEHTPVPVYDTTPVEGIDFNLLPSGFISGQVTDESAGDAPVAGLTVAAVILHPFDYQGWYWVYSATTDSQGNYTIGPLSPKSIYRIYACTDCDNILLVSEYYPDVYNAADAAEISLTPGQTTSDINMSLGQGVLLSGHVSVPGGYDPGNININAWVLDQNYGVGRSTDANGDYIIPVPPIYDSQWGVGVYPQESDLENEWAHRFWLQDQAEWDFDLQPGAAIEGCITDNDIPVTSGGWVQANSVWGEHGAGIGPDGCYRITNLPPGDYTINANNWGGGYIDSFYGGFNIPVRLSAGETESGIDIEIHRQGRITGLVRDSLTLEPLEGIMVAAMNADGYYMSWSQVDGTYNIWMPVGDYKVFYTQDSEESYYGTFYPYAKTYEDAQTFTVLPEDPDGPVEVNIDYHRKAWISGVVTDADTGLPVGGVFVKVHTMGPTGSYDLAWSSYTCTDETGAYSLDAWWPESTYRVTAAGTCGAFQYGQTSQDLFVSTGGDYTVNLQLYAGAIPEAPFTIHADSSQYFPTLNPLDATQTLLFEPLVKLDDQGSWISNLLQQVPTVENGLVQVVDDRMVVTYQLKPGLVWSDGTPLTSADILYTWERFNIPTLYWNGGGQITQIENMETPDALTAVATWYKGFVEPSYLEAIPYLVPEHVLSGTFPFLWDRWYLENPVGNGPYVVESFLTDSHVILRANPNYVLRDQGLPRIESIRVLSLGNPYDLMSNGFAQVALDINDGNSFPAEADSIFNVQATPTSGVEFLWLNNDRPALQDVEVRRALLMAFDRQTVARVGQIEHPLYLMAENFYPPGGALYSEAFPRYTFDLTAAASLLDSAGWVDHNGNGIRDKGGVELDLTMAYPHGHTRRMQIAVTFQEDLESIGIRLTLLEQPSFGTMYDEGAHGRFDMFPVYWFYERFGTSAWNLYHSSQIPTAYNSYNLQSLSRWVDGTNDAWLDAIRTELSFPVLSSEAASWTQHLMDQVPALPIIHTLKYDLAVPTLENFRPASSIPATWNVAEWFLPPNPYDLGVRKTLAATSPAAQPGAQITYRLSVDNFGYYGVSNAVLVDTLPSSLSYVSATPAPSSIVGNTLYWNLGNLAAGQKPPAILLTVLVSGAAQHNDMITNQLQVYFDEPDSNPGNNAVEYTLTVREDVDVWLEKHGIGQPAIGEQFIYFIEYGNFGGAPAAGVVITDTLPAEVILISADPPPTSQDGNQLTWQIGDLPGDQWAGEIRVVAEIAAGGDVSNVAGAAPVPGETSTSNNQDNHDIVVSTILAPVILRPTQGTTDGNFPVKGLAPSDALVSIYNVLDPGNPVLLISGSASSEGTFSLPLTLPEGSYSLVAVAEKGGFTSEYSNGVFIQVSHSLPLDPDGVTIRVDGVDFSAGVVRAEQYSMLAHRLLEIDAVLPCASTPVPQLQVNENGLIQYSVPSVTLVNLGGGEWKASFRFYLANPPSLYDVKLAWDCLGSHYLESLVTIQIDPDGYVYDQALVAAGASITEALVTEAVVTAYAKVGEDWVLWPAHLYNQVNPQLTDTTTADKVLEAGYYSFLTPPGQYRIEASAPGYQPYVSEILTVIAEPIRNDIPLVPVAGGELIQTGLVDLSPSFLGVDQLNVTSGSTLTYSITLENQGGLDTGELTLQADLPQYTEYVSGSLAYDSGTGSFDSTARSITWQGSLASGQTVHISFQVYVGRGPGTNYSVLLEAILSGAPQDLLGLGDLSALTNVEVTGNLVYLPLVGK